MRDKDGVSAALLVAELVATLKAEGRSLVDRLDDLAREHGVYATDAFSVRVDDLSLIGRIMARLRVDAARPRWRASTSPGPTTSRRATAGCPRPRGCATTSPTTRGSSCGPRGTEPKLKVYLEVVEPVTGDDLRGARERAATRLAGIRADLEAATAL